MVGQLVAGEVVITDRQAVGGRAIRTPGGARQIRRFFAEKTYGFVAHSVQLGKRSRDAVEILSGLAARDRCAPGNSYRIKADLPGSEAEVE